MTQKVLPIDTLASVLEREREAGRTVVLCHGVFDLLHPGHIQHLQEARSLGDILVVTVTADTFVNKGPGRPAFGERLRLQSLAALDCVHYVALSESSTAVDVIRRLRPHLYVKGQEYADPSKDLTDKIGEEVSAVEEVGGAVHYSDGEVYSSSTLINRFFRTLSPAAEAWLEGFRSRHSSNEVIDALRRIAEIDVLLVGDIIIDEYYYCEPLAKSPREMIVATRYMREEQFAGGSLAVANHLAGLCRSVTLIASMGPEVQLQEFVQNHLRPNVRLELIPTPTRPTTLKRRFVEYAHLTKMFEMQVVDDSPYDETIEQAVARRIDGELAKHQMVVVADFGHGLLTEKTRDLLSASDKFLAVNAQTNSANLGFNAITRYRRIDYPCIQELEARMALGTKYAPLREVALRILRAVHARSFMVTRGIAGTYLLVDEQTLVEAPSLANRVIDRVGAGDTLFSVTAPLVYLGVDPEIVSLAANCAGALAVQTVCNREFVDRLVLSKFVQHLMK